MDNNKRTVRWHLLQVVTVLFIILFVICPAGCAGAEKSEEADSSVSEEQTKDTVGITFPYELEGGKLMVESLFSSTIENPDNNLEYGEDMATLEITNQSGEYLEEATITVALEDGSMIDFTITNIPDGKKVWVFAKENQVLANDAVCLEIQCTGTYTKDKEAFDDQVEVQVDETDVSLTNLTDQDLNGLTVIYHCVFEDVYFGGISYHAEIADIPTNGSYIFSADECMLGTAEVVDIKK